VSENEKNLVKKRIKMKGIFRIVRISAALAAAVMIGGAGTASPAAQTAPTPAQDKPATLGLGQRFELNSTILNEKREVWVAAPAGPGDGAGERLPVIIQLGDLSHFRYSAPIVDVLSRNGHIPRCLVVAVPDPTPRHHYRDSTPTKVDYLPASGGASLFLDFLKKELLPFIESQFPAASFRIICGHGLSGMFAAWALAESGGAFGAAITDSASLTYDNSRLLEDWTAKPPAFAGPASLYLAAGDERETTEGLRRLAGLFEKNRPDNLDWAVSVEKDEDQGTVCVQAFYKGLKWAFRDWRIPLLAASGGLEIVKAHYAGLSRRLGYEIPVTEGLLSARGFQLIREQKFEEAKLVFNLAASAFPGSFTVEQNLGFLYERMKDPENAAAAYERAAAKAAAAQPDLAKFFKAQAERLRKTVRK